MATTDDKGVGASVSDGVSRLRPIQSEASVPAVEEGVPWLEGDEWFAVNSLSNPGSFVFYNKRLREKFAYLPPGFTASTLPQGFTASF